jgi:hypothetical protein
MQKNTATILKLSLILGLLLILPPPVGATNENIDFGIAKTGSITTPGGVDTFTFSAESNDFIVIRISKTSGEIWPRITLLGPSGNELERTHGASSAELSCSLTVPGLYTILVDDGFQGKYTGEYSLFVQRTNNPGNAKTVHSGTSESGSIKQSGTVDTYLFSAKSGDSIVIRITKTGGEIWPRITLYGPPGKELERTHGASSTELSTSLTLPGIYTILVDDGFQGKYTGDYTLFSQVTLGPQSDAATIPITTAATHEIEQSTTEQVTTGVAEPSSDVQVIYLLFIVIAGAVIGAISIAGKTLFGKPKAIMQVPETITLNKEERVHPSSEAPIPGTVNHDVIISYSSHDKAVADAVCAGLEARKIPCWIAPRDILPGTNYQESIVDAIDSSKILVLIFSNHSNQSAHVLREITRAVNKKVIIIPFRIEDATPSKSMEYLISIPHWLEAMTPPLKKHIDELGDTIQILIENGRKKRDNN